MLLIGNFLIKLKIIMVQLLEQILPKKQSIINNISKQGIIIIIACALVMKNILSVYEEKEIK